MEYISGKGLIRLGYGFRYVKRIQSNVAGKVTFGVQVVRLQQWFSNLRVHRNHLEGFLNTVCRPYPQSVWFSRFVVGPKNWHF